MAEDGHPPATIPTPNSGFLIRDAEAEITRDKKTIHDLEQELARLNPDTQKLPDNRWEGSLLCTFPSEILDEIFQLSCLETGSMLGHAVDSPPLRLSQVCSRWRSIVRSTPKLWATINWITRHHHPNFTKEHDRLQLLDMILDLSSPQPLTLNLEVSMATSGFVCDALQAFGKHSARWLHVSIDCMDTYNSFEVSRCLSGIQQYPILETLDLHVNIRLAIEYAPRLRHATLRSNCLLPWHQLQSLELAYWDYGTLSNFLAVQSATSLAQLTVKDIGFFDEESQLPDRILCPTIQHLKLLSKVGWKTADCLDLINVPNLQVLHLEGYGARARRTPLPMLKVTSFIIHSGFSLKTLSLTNIELNEPDALSLFKLLFSLEELYLEESAWRGPGTLPTILTDAFFNALKGTSSSDALFPNLRHLTIKSSLAQAIPISSTFVDAMIFRSQSDLPRLAVTVLPHALSASDVARIQQHGLEFHFTR